MTYIWSPSNAINQRLHRRVLIFTFLFILYFWPKRVNKNVVVSHNRTIDIQYAKTVFSVCFVNLVKWNELVAVRLISANTYINKRLYSLGLG